MNAVLFFLFDMVFSTTNRQTRPGRILASHIKLYIKGTSYTFFVNDKNFDFV